MSWSPRPEAVLPEYAEKKRESRFTVEGEVHFSFDDPLPHDVIGQLIDYSKSGFRAAHDCPDLTSGQIVSFQHILANGKAQVVWNRINEGTVETGFVILNTH